jgi:ATP citrate (pro-S)-lyase
MFGLQEHLKRLANIDLPLNVLQARADTNFVDALDANEWLKTTKLVVKPDMLFGQRGKHDLVGLNLTFPEAESFITARMNKPVEVNGCSGPITTFIVEPFVPHQVEYYLSFNRCELLWFLSSPPCQAP